MFCIDILYIYASIFISLSDLFFRIIHVNFFFIIFSFIHMQQVWGKVNKSFVRINFIFNRFSTSLNSNIINFHFSSRPTKFMNFFFWYRWNKTKIIQMLDEAKFYWIIEIFCVNFHMKFDNKHHISHSCDINELIVIWNDNPIKLKRISFYSLRDGTLNF